MKTITLVKTHNCVQLGHAYEHLFMAQVKQFFYERRLYKALDFATWGTTYENGGIIEVVCELYSNEAILLADEISQLQIDYGADNINVAKALQIIATEEPWKLEITDKQRVLVELRALDTQPWRDIESIATISTKGQRYKNAPLYLANTPAPKARTLHAKLTLDTDFLNNHQELAPLFNTLARWLFSTVSDQIALESAYFVGEIHGTAQPLSIQQKLYIATYGHSGVDLEKDQAVVMQTIKHMCSSKTVEKYAHDLQKTSYTNAYYFAPDTSRLIQQTNVYIGTLGWQKIATVDNIHLLLENTSLELRFGRKKLLASCLLNLL